MGALPTLEVYDGSGAYRFENAERAVQIVLAALHSDSTAKPLDRAHTTFKNGGIKPITYPPGTVLYRVLDPKSTDNSICWMSKVEIDKLKSKGNWRRRFAVWANWKNQRPESG